MRRNVFVLSVLVVILITTASIGCSHESNPRDYRLDYYMDTIQGHVIISAVCSRNDGNGISVSSVRVETTTQSEKRDIMEKKQSFNNYKTAVEKELNKLYSDSKRNQKLLKETEIYLHFLYENNYSSSEAVVAIVSGL